MGELHLVAEFPDRPPVELAGFAAKKEAKRLTASDMRKNKHIGSFFEDFLKEEGIFEAATTLAVKRVLSWQISQAMKEKGISKIEMAKRMRTSRN
jgi:hypothetical protein